MKPSIWQPRSLHYSNSIGKHQLVISPGAMWHPVGESWVWMLLPCGSEQRYRLPHLHLHDVAGLQGSGVILQGREVAHHAALCRTTGMSRSRSLWYAQGRLQGMSCYSLVDGNAGGECHTLLNGLALEAGRCLPAIGSIEFSWYRQSPCQQLGALCIVMKLT
jgi:hypothetical protein